MDHNFNEFLDKVGTSRVIQHIKERVSTVLMEATFAEYNNSATRKRLEENVNNFLRELRSRKAIRGYFVRCDEINNPPSVIDSHRFHLDVYVTTNTSSDFIHIPFTVTLEAMDRGEKYDNAMKGIQ